MVSNHTGTGFKIGLSILYFIVFIHCCIAEDGLQSDPNSININVHADTVSSRYNISTGTTKIFIKNITQDDGFFLIQVHSFAQKVNLTNDTNFNLQSTVCGNDIGLVKILLPTDATKTFPFYLRANQDGMVLIAVSVYSSADPIPGGCSMTFNTEIAPYINLTYTNALIEVNYQDSSIFGYFCEDNAVQLQMYRLYVDPNDLSASTHFDNIQSMLSVNDIRKNGENITERGGLTSSLRKYISGYMGLGQVIVVVAVAGGTSSAYVPTVTYSCNAINGSDSCYDYDFTWWGLLATGVLILGILMLIAEDWVGLITVFILSVGTAIYTFYNVSIYSDISIFVIISCIIGLIILYCIYGCIAYKTRNVDGMNGKQSNFLTSLLCGLFIGVLTVTSGLNDNYDPSLYWFIFIAISALLFTLIFGMTFVNPFGYNLLAVFLIVTSFSYLSGDTFHYAVAEVVRNMVVEHYNIAVKVNLYSVRCIVLLIVGTFIAMLRTICTKEEGSRRLTIRITRRRTHLDYTHI